MFEIALVTVILTKALRGLYKLQKEVVKKYDQTLDFAFSFYCLCSKFSTSYVYCFTVNFEYSKSESFFISRSKNLDVIYSLHSLMISSNK